MNTGEAGLWVVLAVAACIALLAWGTALLRRGATRREFAAFCVLALLPLYAAVSGALINHMAGLHLIVQLGPAYTPVDDARVSESVHHMLMLGLFATAAPLLLGIVGRTRAARGAEIDRTP